MLGGHALFVSVIHDVAVSEVDFACSLGEDTIIVVSPDQLSADMQPFALQLVEQAGIVPQAQDRPLNSNDLLFYLSETSMPMAGFMRKQGLFMDAAGLHFDLAQFNAIRELAGKVVTEYEANHLDGVWKEFDLSGEDDVNYDGYYILTALDALELIYGARSKPDSQCSRNV